MHDRHALVGVDFGNDRLGVATGAENEPAAADRGRRHARAGSDGKAPTLLVVEPHTSAEISTEADEGLEVLHPDIFGEEMEDVAGVPGTLAGCEALEAEVEGVILDRLPGRKPGPDPAELLGAFEEEDPRRTLRNSFSKHGDAADPSADDHGVEDGVVVIRLLRNGGRGLHE